MLPANASATMIRYDCQLCLYNNRIQLKGPVCLGVLTFYTFTTCSNETLHTVLILVMRHETINCYFPIFDFLKRVCFVSGFVPSCTLLVSHLPPSSCSRTHLPAFPHMFWPRGWSVRIALFIFEWQCAMSNRWSCTKPANPEARGNSLMWWNLKAEGSGMRPKVIPHYH